MQLDSSTGGNASVVLTNEGRTLVGANPLLGHVENTGRLVGATLAPRRASGVGSDNRNAGVLYLVVRTELDK